MIIHGQDDDRPSMDWVFDEEAAAAVDCRFRYKLKRGNGHTALVLLWVDVIDSISAAARRELGLSEVRSRAVLVGGRNAVGRVAAVEDPRHPGDLSRIIAETIERGLVRT